MSAGRRALAAAHQAIGVRFRLHGRDPASGLDCVGLALLAMRAGGFSGAVPADYALRGGDALAIAAQIDARGLLRVTDNGLPGDLILCASGPAQLHFAIQAQDGVIHADLMLRRVVHRPGAVPWRIISRWRLPDME